jgi:hypothetical protein
MRNSTRLLAAGLLSVVALGLLPAQGAGVATAMRPATNVYCCR